MAQRTIVRLVDDLDHEEVAGEGHTFLIAFDAMQYEIDLNEEHAEELHRKLEPYIAAARRLERPAGMFGFGSTDPEPHAVREWARAEGITVRNRGRIPKAIQDAYDAAH